MGSKKNIHLQNSFKSPIIFETLKTWSGDSLNSFTHLSSTNVNVPPVEVSADHKVYFKLPLSEKEAPLPYPEKYVGSWNNKYVRMPNSSESLYEPNENSNPVDRWSVICKAFQKPISSIAELNHAILSYNQQYKNKWNFKGLALLVENKFAEDERKEFFEVTLPQIIKLAFDLPAIVTRPPLLLKKNQNSSMSLSQKQISSLLANAFLCTFPMRNKEESPEYYSYPDINFNRLFFHVKLHALEKMKCILQYFKEVTSNEPDGVVTFSRQSISYNNMPNFEEINKPFLKCWSDSKTPIEEMKGLLQVDFANKRLGGGVLGLGCVQEEIRFVLCPELLVTRLFTEVLDGSETLITTGVRQFSAGEGYSSTFQWKGPYEDDTLRDAYKRRLCQVVAMDALHFSRNPHNQYQKDIIKRELEKSYAGFRVLNGSEGQTVGVATGNWGCGAFKGDPRLKSLIQLATAGTTGRDLAYCSFGDEQLRDDLTEMHTFLVEKKVTIGKLVSILYEYSSSKKQVDGSDLSEFIKHSIRKQC